MLNDNFLNIVIGFLNIIDAISTLCIYRKILENGVLKVIVV